MREFTAQGNGCHGAGFMPAGETDEDKRVEFQRLCAAVMNSESRNRLIVAEIVQAVKAGRSPLILTERTEHLEMLVLAVRQHVAHVITLQGGMGRKSLAAAMDPLAQRFVHAARPLAPDAEGADRARSASEAFIFRCFETLPELRGRFRLNALLPIPFDDRGEMEDVN